MLLMQIANDIKHSKYLFLLYKGSHTENRIFDIACIGIVNGILYCIVSLLNKSQELEITVNKGVHPTYGHLD